PGLRSLPSLSALFFSPCSGHLRTLHSFPTRRSSDLNAAQCSPVFLHPRPYAARSFLQLCLPQLPATQKILSHTKPLPATSNAVVDRKSTRLNSSHVKISYAVFCLKKKRKARSHELLE